jgi:hypothetical protein
MSQRVLFLLVDTETTKKNGLVFDAAFELFDRKGNTFETGSYIFKDVLAIEEPFYKEKIAQYWSLTYKQKVKPVMFRTFRRIFNAMIARYLKRNYKIILCAYNAAFDTTHLAQNARDLLDNSTFLTSDSRGVYFLDLWYAWVQGCPIDYGYFAPFSDKGNIRTNAENVYRYISETHDFEEKHIAHSDILIEKVILMDILRRKKKLPLVDNPTKFQAMPWKLAQERCKVPIAERKARQALMAPILKSVPDLTEKSGHMTDKPTILFPE